MFRLRSARILTITLDAMPSPILEEEEKDSMMMEKIEAQDGAGQERLCVVL